MNSDNFNEAINDLKKWVSINHYDQDYIDIGKGNNELSKTIEKLQESKNAEVKKLDDFFPKEFFSKVEVLLITISDHQEEKTLIEKMSQAIDSRIAKSISVDGRVLENNNLWKLLFDEAKKLKHILIPELEFYRLPLLMQHYQKVPIRALCGVSVFFLADLKSYIQDVTMKKSLWETLLREL